MGLRTSLRDGDEILVADTSFIINLNATEYAPRVLEALPFRIVAVDAVVEELEYGRVKGRDDAEQFKALVAKKLIDVVALGKDGLMHFEGLVIGAASETLDDGEAATIAFAAEGSAVALLDERKALRLCASRFPALRAASTVDVLAHPAVMGLLGETALADAIFNALTGARMRVLPHHINDLVTFIGGSRAATCVSLPRRARDGL